MEQRMRQAETLRSLLASLRKSASFSDDTKRVIRTALDSLTVEESGHTVRSEVKREGKANGNLRSKENRDDAIDHP
jgi:hypothetical protein